MQPSIETLQYRDILLDHQKERSRGVKVNTKRIRASLGKIALFLTCGNGIGYCMFESFIAANAYLLRKTFFILSHVLRVKAQETFVESGLCLAAQIVMYAGKDDNKIKPRISSFADKSSVIRCFPRLHLANNQTFFINLSILHLRIEQVIQYLVCEVVKMSDNSIREVFILLQILHITSPEIPISSLVSLELFQPWHSAFASFKNLEIIYLGGIVCQQGILQKIFVDIGVYHCGLINGRNDILVCYWSHTFQYLLGYVICGIEMVLHSVIVNRLILQNC